MLIYFIIHRSTCSSLVVVGLVSAAFAFTFTFTFTFTFHSSYVIIHISVVCCNYIIRRKNNTNTQCWYMYSPLLLLFFCNLYFITTIGPLGTDIGLLVELEKGIPISLHSYQLPTPCSFLSRWQGLYPVKRTSWWSAPSFEHHTGHAKVRDASFIPSFLRWLM